MRNHKAFKNWVYVPLVFSSVTLLSAQVSAGGPAGQQYQEARQVGAANYEYVGGRTQVGGYITDDGDVSADINHIFRETETSSTSVGLWAGVDLDEGDDEKGGVQVNHNWLSMDKAGNPIRVNKVFAAYDRNQDKHDKATLGYGQEYENLFWEGHVSKGLSDKKTVKGLKDKNGKQVYSKAYDHGIGGSIGTFLKHSNTRVRAGLDHEWGNDVGNGEDDATNTTLSAGIEKFFQGTPHSVSMDVAASRKDGGTELSGFDDTDISASLGYHYDFGGASIYQPDRQYRRTRVEIPGVARPAQYAKQPLYKRVPTYKTVPVFDQKTVKTPFKQLVKSTMELEGETFFKLNSDKLIPSAQTRLKLIAKEIRKNGYKGAIRITGNTCGLGDPAYDQRLSEQRAKAVRNFLIKQGFNPDHLIARGLGKGHPKYPNTPSQDFKNRRVDIEYVTVSESYKTGYRTEQKAVQTGTRQVATGFKNVPAGFKNVMIDSGAPGTPRVIWKTEAIKTSPAWIKRALHNNIQHNRNVNTYLSTDYIAEDPAPEPVNHAPVAANDFVKTECNSPVDINVLANDNDEEDVPTIQSFGNPQYGTVTQGANGLLIYTPYKDVCGQTDKFTYTITDGKASSTAMVTIEIAKSNSGCNTKECPSGTTVATEDSFTTELEKPILMDVLSNDVGTGLKITELDLPSHGITELVGNQIKYTPAAGYIGTDSFFYQITDASGYQTSAKVTVIITGDGTGGGEPEPGITEAKPDSASTEMDKALLIDVLKNDTGTGLKITELDSPSHGTTELAGNEIKYTPAAGYIGSDSFFYQITDASGYKTSTEVTVTVTDNGTGDGTGGGDPEPGITEAKPDSATTGMDKALLIDVLKNDTGTGLKITELDSPSHGTTELVGNQIKYTPTTGYVGTDSFWYQITDASGYKTSTQVSLTVTANEGGGNPDPIVAKDDVATTTKGKGILINVLDNDSSGLTITSVAQSSNSFVEILNGSLSYLPNSNFVGTDSFTYSVKDGNNQTAQATVKVTVNDITSGPNQPPKANEDAVETSINNPITVDVLINDTDPDNDNLEITDVTQPAHGSAKISGNQIVYTPDGTVGSMSMTYTITDNHGHTDQTVLTIAVTDPNDGNIHFPVIVNENVTVSQGGTILIDVLANDSDLDGDTLILDQVDSGSNGLVEKENGQVRYTPLPEFFGTDQFYYGVHDGHGHNGSGLVTITVTPAP